VRGEIDGGADGEADGANRKGNESKLYIVSNDFVK
jgi:hypothetical protein